MDIENDTPNIRTIISDNSYITTSEAWVLQLTDLLFNTTHWLSSSHYSIQLFSMPYTTTHFYSNSKRPKNTNELDLLNYIIFSKFDKLVQMLFAYSILIWICFSQSILQFLSKGSM